MVTAGARRDAVAHVCEEHDVSQRRACAILAVDRSSVRYRSVRPDDASIREAMRQVASERRRFGCRRIHVMLARQGIVMNLKKLRRLYRKRSLPSANLVAASGPWERDGPLHDRHGPTNGRASISSAMRSPMDGGRAFWPLSTTSHGSAWHWSRTPPFRVCV